MSNNGLNILLLTIDCWRADYFRTGSRLPSPTPRLDHLAKEALVFDQAVTCGGWTRPSLAALFSSTHASMYGGPLGRYSPERPSLPELLRQHGYRTAGLTTNPQVGQAYGFDRGFDIFVDCEPDGTYPGPKWSKVKGAQRVLQQPFFHHFASRLGARLLPPEVTAPAEQLTDQIAYLFQEPQTQPLFVWAHFMDAHWPYHVLRRPYSPAELAQTWRDLQVMYRVSEQHGWLNPGRKQIERLIEIYCQALSYVDHRIGKLLDWLKASDLWERTAVIITADHGEEFYEHGRWSHFQLYDESLLVPLLVRLPRVPGRTIHDQVSLLDLAPMILTLAGAPRPVEMLGVDLLQRAGGRGSGNREAYAEVMWEDAYRLAIRTEEYKYLYDQQKPDEPKLFDLRSDPYESQNIYLQRKKIAGQFEELRAAHQRRAEATSAKKGGLSVQVDAVMGERLRSLGYIE